MADSIKISTEQVVQIAGELEALNKKLESELNDSKADIDSLKGIWGGQAADDFYKNFDAFATQYFEEYKNMIDAYVKFLRDRVAQGYFDTETTNIGISNSFK